MADWKDRAEVNGDVVFFRGTQPEVEKAAQEVFIWDLDKTYLDTRIDSLGGILTAAIERAFSKKNIPGTDTLLRTLSQERIEAGASALFPIYFITASPPQMEERIAEKFSFDNIVPLGCFYKDNLKNLRPGRFARLTKHVGYKLQALMQLRVRLGPHVRQICFGDDSESDAIIYNLYSDICARRLSAGEIREILAKLFVIGEQVDTIMGLQAQVPSMDPVARIYINLATDTDPEYYFKFGRRTLATYNTFQLAIDLLQNRRITLEGVFAVAEDMIQNYGYTPDELIQSIDELIRRGVLGARSFGELSAFLIQKSLLYPTFRPALPPAAEKTVEDGWVQLLDGVLEPWLPERIEYLNDDR